MSDLAVNILLTECSWLWMGDSQSLEEFWLSECQLSRSLLPREWVESQCSVATLFSVSESHCYFPIPPLRSSLPHSGLEKRNLPVLGSSVSHQLHIGPVGLFQHYMQHTYCRRSPDQVPFFGSSSTDQTEILYFKNNFDYNSNYFKRNKALIKEDIMEIKSESQEV